MSSETKTKFDSIKTLSDKYLLNTYNRYPVAFQYGVGEMIFDQDNKGYIDFLAGIAVSNLGHGEADLIEAIRNQMDKIFHSSNLYYSEEQAKLAEVIIENSIPGKVFLCNSGTEANEAAFKLMRRHGVNQNIDKPVILALHSSFHGRTLSAMSMTGNESVRNGFGELAADIHFVEANNEDSLIQAFEQYGGSIAGIIMELIIGEGGVIPLSQSFVNLARKLTEETNSLLVFDEIQTGMGRTGKMFCFEHYGMYPDAFTLAKALGSGFPMGAIVVSKEYESVLEKGMHGSTFGGNHLACVAAYETFKIILSRNLLDHVATISEQMFLRLKQMMESTGKIKEVRGRGLHIGVELFTESRPVVEECLKRGLVVNSTAGKVIRIIPPLILSIEKATEGLDILESVLKEMK
ncbi:aspartate aminotransferase family protein [Leptospira levettii]|uniref:aspartate aminotransferase family protein n=1 Tax=Leptospira levettii TaxID=2023178 RepID=UPI001082F05B|nr:aspartate aminotransferase family protein [Leptospira levettii]MCW7506250.1 aspartate aminotransferase family protein [Leptospira levettii]MCW7517340.1 aspartate aminotransferase family protein [Leptospira levettii]TGL00908.1 aspartate aminotransferase family protein [Leptospira levettii]